MTDLIKNNEGEFAAFLIQHAQKRLSGTTVLSWDQMAGIRSSIIFVLQHAQTGEHIAERFEDGQQQIKRKIEEIRTLYQKIMQNYQSFGIESMELTIQEFANFFSTYDIDYAANLEGEIWIDYQLANPVDTSALFGVDFVFEYLVSFYQEVKFVQLFPKATIQQALTIYQNQLKFDYRKDINNLYEVVFNQALAKIFTGSVSEENNEQNLLLTRKELAYLYGNQRFIKSEPKIQLLCQNNPYYQRSLEKFLLKIQMISSSQDLKNFLLWKREESEIMIELKKPMTAEKYATLAEKISSQPEEMLDFIVEEVSSPYDLLELIEGDLIAEDLLEELFLQLPLDLLSGFLLLLKQRNYGLIDSLTNLQTMREEEPVIKQMEKRLQELTDNEITELNERLATYELNAHDFS